MAERAALVDYETKENRTDPSSNYSWSKLSPGSQERRRKKLVKERRDLLRKVAKISDATSEINTYTLYQHFKLGADF